MNIIGIILIVIGGIGLLLSPMMFGDIGIAAAIAGLGSLLSGIGFVIANKKFKQMNAK